MKRIIDLVDDVLWLLLADATAVSDDSRFRNYKKPAWQHCLLHRILWP